MVVIVLTCVMGELGEVVGPFASEEEAELFIDSAYRPAFEHERRKSIWWRGSKMYTNIRHLHESNSPNVNQE